MRRVLLASVVTAVCAFGVFQAAPAATAGGKNISLNVKDADLAVALETMFKQAGVSYVLSGDVKGNVTAIVQDQPLSQALASLLKPFHLKASESDGIYTVEKVVKPAKKKPTASEEILKQLPAVKKQAPAQVSADKGLNAQASASGAIGASPVYYYPYAGNVDVRLSPGMYYSPALQIPGVLVLPRPFYYGQPLMVGGPPLYNGPYAFGAYGPYSGPLPYYPPGR